MIKQAVTLSTKCYCELKELRKLYVPLFFVVVPSLAQIIMDALKQLKCRLHSMWPQHQAMNGFMNESVCAVQVCVCVYCALLIIRHKKLFIY